MYPQLINGKSSPQSVFTTSTTRRHPIGTAGYSDDGRRFRYASLVDTTAIGPNKLAQSCPPVANHVSETGTSTGTTVANTSDSYKSITATLGATAAYADEYENGLFKIESATTGAGQAWRVPGHAAVLSAGVLTFQTKEPVVTATSGTTTWSFVHNPWGSVVIQPTTITANAAGVTLVNWPAATTAAPIYGWLQTWGQVSCLIDTSNIVAGSGLIPGGTTAGALGVAVETDIKQRVGVAIEALSTDNAYASVFLMIA